MQFNLADLAMRVVVYFIPFLFALCFHEVAHGWVARLRGDNTAKMMGRLTMNPLAHMDPWGTFIIPLIGMLFPSSGIFFGWAKPVPVNERNLKNPRVDMFWIALAGPASNLLLALISALVMGLLGKIMITSVYYKPTLEFLNVFISINLFLAVFNSLPLHPLDGGKILARFLPHSINDQLEQNAYLTSMILMVLIYMNALNFLVIPVRFLHGLLLMIAQVA
jgi:Zn-dependent protease